MADSWTKERTDTLRQLWADGLTASEIRDRMGDGLTRNSVIGKATRLKLARRGTPANFLGAQESPKEPQFRWTPELVQQLSDHWNAGRTASDIATRMELPIGVIHGKLSHLRSKGTIKPRQQIIDDRHLVGRAVVVQHKPEPTAAPRGAVSLLDAGLTACREPFAKMMCCGAEVVPGQPYCPDHCAKNFYNWKATATHGEQHA